MSSCRATLVAVLALLVAACGASREEGSVEESPRGAEAATVPAPTAVWLDVDPAIGLPESEVDDGVMLMQAFHSPEVRIAGVSVVFGNTSLENGLPIARQLVGRFGPPGLEVHSGAASADQLGEETDAVRAMAQALAREPLVLLAVGPVTNAATLVELHPELHDRIRSIVMVAGRRPGQEFRSGDAEASFRDFNFELDAVAMQRLLDTDIELVFAPWEVSSHVWLREPDLDWLSEQSEAGAWLAAACRSWLARWQRTLRLDGFNPFDTLALAWVTHPQLIESFEGGAWIEELEDDTEPNSGKHKPYLLVDPERRELRQVTYTYRPADAFQPLLLERLAGSPSSETGGDR